MSDEYQPRTIGRLIEMLDAQDQNPRSWQQEAKRALQAAAAREGEPRMLDEDGELRSMVDIKADAIRFAVRHSCGNATKAATGLRIGRMTLYRYCPAPKAYAGISPIPGVASVPDVV